MRKSHGTLFYIFYILSLSWLLEGAVLFYRRGISPLMKNVCAFRPSCSNYMLLSIRRFGPIKGVFLGTKRLLRCQPWAKGGLDPVPIKKSSYKWLY